MVDYQKREAGFFAHSPIDLPDVTAIEPLARSGESIVYRGIQRHVGEVSIKIGCRMLVETCVEAAAQEVYAGLPVSEAFEVTEQRFHVDRSARLARTRDRLRQLEQYFGESVVAEDSSIRKVALQGSLLAYCLCSQILEPAYLPKLSSSDIYFVETLVRIQPFIVSLQDPKRFTLSTCYAEIKRDNAGFITEEEYKAATEALVFQDADSLKDASDIENLLRIQGSSYLRGLAIRLRTDPELSRSLCIFLESLTEYVSVTGGTIIDAIGKDNVIFNPTCIMSDGLYAGDVHPLASSARTLQVIAEHKRPPREDMNQLYNALNFVRGMNIIALACKSKAQFSILPPESRELEYILDEIIAMCLAQHGLSGESRIVKLE